MKKNNFLAAASLSLCLLAGCSSAPVSKTVETTCSAEENGMSMKMTVTAPNADAPISSMKVTISASLDELAGQLGVDKDTISQYKDLIETSMKQSIGASDEDKISFEMTDDAMVITVEVKGKEEFEQITGTTIKDEDMIYKNVVEELKSSTNSELKCS